MNIRKFACSFCALAMACFSWQFAAGAEPPKPTPSPASADRPAPAVPLIACDPYFSVWSSAPRLADVDTTHWTGKPHRLTCLVSIDGREYRLMGAAPAGLPAATQISRTITPTQTKYRFSQDGIELSLRFTTPALPTDLDVLSRPITYLTYDVRSRDGKAHRVRVYFEASAELTVNAPNQLAVGTIENPDGLIALRMGSEEQAVLKKAGDDLRIDWGYFYLAANTDSVSSYAIGNPASLRAEFSASKSKSADAEPAAIPADQLAAAVTFELPEVGYEEQSRWLVLAYDDLFSIEYMKRPMRPYWRRNGMDAHALLTQSAAEYAILLDRCDEFDCELMADLEQAGGPEYAHLAALAFRQCFAAGKFVADANGQPIQFCKENHSNGCIATSDVFYPMSPQFLLFGPSVAKSFVVPFMDYSTSDRWKFSYAPHDLGTYPKANGQVYGGGETSERDQMPVEESGNLLILMAAIAKMEGHAEFASRYWPQLTQWAEYLKQKGFDPENQLCTDDFAGHLGHNVNLSAKAICGLGAFAQLCELRGNKALAAEYRQTAKDYMVKWVAAADDGDHFRLAFDRPGTWSQKYNLVWDRILDLNLFPDEVFAKEMEYYRRTQNHYGLPLDNRQQYTKLDWILWTATLTQNQDDFRALVAPVSRFLTDSSDRAPLTDWYQTDSAKKVGFTARPVVGGVFLKLLYDDEVWTKWAQRDQTDAKGYAPMPKLPVVVNRVPAADTAPANWRFTTIPPGENWHSADFDSSHWQQGPAGFGTRNTPGTNVQTVWDSGEIWLRREFDISDDVIDTLQLHIHHDEDVEVYINGVLAYRAHGYSMAYEQATIESAARQAIKPAGNILAVHCRQTAGGQYIDVGLVTIDAVEN